MDAYRGVGVEFVEAKATLGRSDKLSGNTLQTAEFDLSTAAGNAAYDKFMATGGMPNRNEQVISGVSTTEKVDFSSQS